MPAQVLVYISMKWFIGAIITSGILFYLLQSSDDAKADRNGVPRASNGKKIATFFFVTILCVVVFYLMSNAYGSSSDKTMGGSTGGRDAPSSGKPTSMPVSNMSAPKLDKRLLETHMIKSIREDVNVGGAPF